MSEPINRDVFLTLSPEEQAVEVGKRLPKFAALPKDKQQEYLAQIRTRLTTKDQPTPSKMIGEGFKRRAGDIGAAIGATVVPGSGLVGVLSRLGGAEVGQEIGELATRGKTTPGYGAATQLVGEGVAAVTAPLLSPATYRAFAKRNAKEIATALQELVPAFSGYAADEKGLYEMAHGTGQRSLSTTFERELQAVKRQIPETVIVRLPKVAEHPTTHELVHSTEPKNALVLIDELPSLRKAGGRAYHDALRALASDLPDSVSNELNAARTAYRTGAGFIEFATKGKFLYGERYDPATAMKALDRFGKSLTNRGMDQIRALVRGPESEPIKTTTHSPWAKRLYGAAIGEGIGYPFGIPGYVAGPVVGGAAGERFLPSQTYRNVPGPAAKWAERMLPVTVGAGARELARRGNVEEKLPQFPRGE